MSSITEIEKLKLEAAFSMNGGYVLDFTNQSFQRFINNTVKLDIYNPKYSIYGTSKAKMLRAFWEIESDSVVGKLTEQMLLYYEAQSKINAQTAFNKELFDSCLPIAHRLQGKKQQAKENTVEDFLKIEVDEVSIASLKIDGAVTAVLEQRIIEIKQCINNGASLSVIFLCGSVLKGILLGVATNNIKEFNQSTASPKDKSTGKVKQFQDWTLSSFIDVAHDLKFLGLDVKKYGHTLRDFRNYIHPYEQMSSGFKPDKHTAKISWQVLKAAIHDIYEKTK